MILARNHRTSRLHTVAEWLQSHTDYEMKVIFCCFDARTAQAYQTKMKME